MADWFVSSATYASVPTFAISQTYAVGNLVKPTAPPQQQLWVFRCTVAGTSAPTEPSWPTQNNGSIVSGGATFVNVTGQGTFGWSAAAGDLPSLTGGSFPRILSGDRVFVSSDHTESQSSSPTYGTVTGGSYVPVYFLSVNRAGSVPPVAADLKIGATLITISNAQFVITNRVESYYYGFIMQNAGTSSFTIGWNAGLTSPKSIYFKDCALSVTSPSNSNGFFVVDATATLDNTTIQFSHVNQELTCAGQGGEFVWVNTLFNTISGSTALPSFLFSQTGNNGHAGLYTCRGVDLSGYTTGTLLADSNGGNKLLLDSCIIAPSVTRLSSTAAASNTQVQLINCFDGTNFISEQHSLVGSVTTEFNIYLSLPPGAQDDVGNYAHKMVANSNVNKFTSPLLGFWMDTENTLVGAVRTATVEFVSSGVLNNDDISLLLEYQATLGSSVTSFVSSGVQSILEIPSSVTNSAATWHALPLTPVRQKLVVLFTPQQAGRVRGYVRLGKATTVYYNPQIVIT